MISNQTIPNNQSSTKKDKKELDISINKNIEMKQDSENEDNDSDLISNLLTSDKIRDIMSSSGPVVKSLLLKSDGSILEIDYDSTPSKNAVSEILCAPPSIIGQWTDLDVILVGPRIDDNNRSKFLLNQHKLRYPFNNCTFFGDIFLYKFDQDCNVVDFPLNEYKLFSDKIDEDCDKIWNNNDNINDENEGENDEYFDEEYDEDDIMNQQYEFMRNTIINKIKIDFPKQFGRDPNQEELQEFVNAAMQSVNGLFSAQNDDNNDDNDDDYDPANDPDKHQAVLDQVEDILNENDLKKDKNDINQMKIEKEMTLKDVDDNDEEKLFGDESFQNELNDAIKSVQHLAQFDKNLILQRAREQYLIDTGCKPTDDMISDAFKLFSFDNDNDIDDNDDNDNDDNNDNNNNDNDNDNDDNDNNDDITVTPSEFEKEYNLGLDNIRNLGQKHGKILRNYVSDMYTKVNGTDASKDDINQILNEIQKKLANEAKDEFLERNNDDINDNNDDDSDDSDYNPDDDQFDYSADIRDDQILNNNNDDKQLINTAKCVLLNYLKKNEIKNFVNKNNRNPNDFELDEITSKLNSFKFDDDDNDDNDDEDYVPDNNDIKQIEDDKKIDVLNELISKIKIDDKANDKDTDKNKCNNKDNDLVTVKVLTTPIKKKKSGSCFDMYLKDPQPTSIKKLQIASSKFEQINGRAPNDNDTKRLKDFLSTGMLFESEYTTKLNKDNDDNNDDGSDYNPDNDQYDYTNDDKDDLISDNDENDDTSNMVDID